MDLTPDIKNYIDTLSYEQLSYRRRYMLVGDLWFEGEAGEYWNKRMLELRELNPDVAVYN